MKENFTKKIIILIANKKTSIDECDKTINLKNDNISLYLELKNLLI